MPVLVARACGINLFLAVTVTACVLYFSSSQQTPSSQASGDLRLATFNIRYADAPDGQNHWKLRKKVTAATIREMEAHVIGVQEGLDHALDFLQEDCDGFQWVGGVDGHAADSAILFDSRVVDLIDWHTMYLSDTPDVRSRLPASPNYRTATWARFLHRAKGRAFTVVNTHLCHRRESTRRQQAEIMQQEIRRLATSQEDSSPIFVTGDFNTIRGSSTHKELVPDTLPRFRFLEDSCCSTLSRAERKSRVFSTFHGFTGTLFEAAWIRLPLQLLLSITPLLGLDLAGAVPARDAHIDWILFTPHQAECVASQVKLPERLTPPFPSDHHPVVATFNFTGHPGERFDSFHGQHPEATRG